MKIVVPIALSLVATLVAVMASRLITRSAFRIEWPHAVELAESAS